MKHVSFSKNYKVQKLNNFNKAVTYINVNEVVFPYFFSKHYGNIIVFCKYNPGVVF